MMLGTQKDRLAYPYCDEEAEAEAGACPLCYYWPAAAAAAALEAARWQHFRKRPWLIARVQRFVVVVDDDDAVAAAADAAEVIEAAFYG